MAQGRTSTQLPDGFYDRANALIADRPDLGYSSATDLFKDGIRRLLDYLEADTEARKRAKQSRGAEDWRHRRD